MSLLVAENLGLRFGPQEILHGAGFMISAGDRVGVVGPNGTGKSTLFRIIAGRQPLDEGKLHFARGTELGYLPQDILEVGTLPLLESVLAAVPGKSDLESRLALAEGELHECDDPERQLELAQRIVDLHAHIELFESEYSQHEAERILLGLGFRTADFNRSLAEFSGGWKMRAALAGLLFKRPDMLLLDEPTNHLDMPSVTWLDEFLRQFKNAILLISHDRDFVNGQVSRILSFEVEGLRSYTGNYDTYRLTRESELEVRAAARRNQDHEIRQAEVFIRRFRATASKARQVQSRMKAIEKIDLVEVDHERAKIKFSFPPTERIGKLAMETRRLGHRFGDLQLYRDLNLMVQRGDRVAIFGRNGAGKTTLLRILAGELEASEGEIEYGANVAISYYAQHHSEKLSREHTILDEVWSTNPSLTRTAVRTICGAFLFSGDMVEKPIGVLSGGELARVSLAKLLVKPGNVLLMDEPTNQLDIFSAEALAETLQTYDGTLLFVSHNHSFINRLANKVWNIENGELEEYPGNLDEYFYHLKTGQRAPAAPSLKKATAAPDKSAATANPDLFPSPAPAPAPDKEDNKTRQEERKRLNRERARLERQIHDAEKEAAELEKSITELSNRRAAMEKELADPATYDNPERYNALLDEYRKAQEREERLTTRWTDLLEKAERYGEQLKKLPTT
ncbi:MAG: ABC-F family ATP-binding cassette domain-containing protein [Myxococcales bacterium]|nr:ABC-F family ATP-binding cassette domain-containing protein [Myxococcales bacterium]